MAVPGISIGLRKGVLFVVPTYSPGPGTYIDKGPVAQCASFDAETIGRNAIAALGEFVGRGRPVPEPTGPAFPSGHTYGSTLLFGFTGFMLYRTRLRRKAVWFLLAVLTLLTLSAGASRVFLSAHWPSDVVGGYLLGLALLTLMIRMYGPCERGWWALWGSNPRPAD